MLGGDAVQLKTELKTVRYPPMLKFSFLLWLSWDRVLKP